MAFISSKFNMPNYAGSGCANYKEYADLYLTKLKTAFIDANSAWSLETNIETIGSYQGTSVGIRTLQLKSSASGKYLRIWAFCSSSVRCTIKEQESQNTSSDPINIYAGNLFKNNYSSSSGYYRIGHNSIIYFGVSSSSIDADPGKDLGLDIPMFGKENRGDTVGTFSVCSSGKDVIVAGGVLSVITDGNMFEIIAYSEGYTKAVIYAPDLFVCANSSDNETAGVISASHDNGNFDLGDDNNSNHYISCLFNAADGTHDFNGMVQGFDNGRSNGRALTSENSTKMLCAPITVWMYPYTYSGSTMEGIVDKIGLKGWINPNYLRSIDSRVLPVGSKGMTYGNGRWLCVNKGALIAWDASNSSPFEAAVEGGNGQ